MQAETRPMPMVMMPKPRKERQYEAFKLIYSAGTYAGTKAPMEVEQPSGAASAA